MARNVVPTVVVDGLMHVKTSDRTESIVLPITRYANILSSPNIITDVVETEGAPFHLLKTGTDTITEEELLRLCGQIL